MKFLKQFKKVSHSVSLCSILMMAGGSNAYARLSLADLQQQIDEHHAEEVVTTNSFGVNTFAVTSAALPPDTSSRIWLNSAYVAEDGSDMTLLGRFEEFTVITLNGELLNCTIEAVAEPSSVLCDMPATLEPGIYRLEAFLEEDGVVTKSLEYYGVLDLPIGIIGDPGIQGEAGPQGELGATGAQGETGATGLQGSEGVAGPKGEIGGTGAQGEIGLTGPEGPTGVAGPTGETGPAGVTGPQGEAGLQGAVGVKGDTGSKGESGAVGPIGATGPQGAVGVKGDTGSKGEAGAVGPIGATGPQGAVGVKGDTGSKGDIGGVGPAGTTGAQGDAGPQGVAGAAGSQGEVGPQGESGAQGETGETGVEGAVGPIGETGAEGAQGPAGEGASLPVCGDNEILIFSSLNAEWECRTDKLYDARVIITKNYADSVCGAEATAITVPISYFKKSGDEICAENAQRLTQCASVKSLFIRNDLIAGSTGLGVPCSQSLNDIPAWPWAKEVQDKPSTDSLDYRHRSYLVCCR
ncbi:MAG: hypothetical protein GQ582_03590 [Methyloprofundus sp.]|nr:hypothetical protein [Methyloprofundus sp.]